MASMPITLVCEAIKAARTSTKDVEFSLYISSASHHALSSLDWYVIGSHFFGDALILCTYSPFLCWIERKMR